MKKYEILKKIQNSGVIAVVRADSEEHAEEICDACYEGGITALEVTYTVPGANKVIKKQIDKKRDEQIVGAGTVLDSVTARIAIMEGAEFIVSPSFDAETAMLCNRYQIPYIPGCYTLNEVIKATEYGCDVVKLFPGTLADPSYIKAIKGPLPNVEIIPTGGVDLDNYKDWLAVGCFAVGIGSALTKGSKDDIYQKSVKFKEVFSNNSNL